MSKFFFLTSLILLGLLSACDYSKLMNMGNGDSGNESLMLPQAEQQQLSFAYVYQTVLFPKCTTCHGTAGHVNLETYASTVQNMAKIKKAVFSDRDMPKDDVLTQEEKAILWNWIARGAPEVGEAPAPPAMDPIEPTFASLDKNIFSRSCVKCHSAGHKAEKVPLDYASLIKNGTITPGDPDQSKLVIAVERTDKKQMPPQKAGYRPLTDEEKTAIREWIKNGAQD